MKTPIHCLGPHRRDFMRVGGLTAMGLGLGNFFQLQRAIADEHPEQTIPAKAKSCILIWLSGGPSHLEMFDPKPDAPSEVRGPMSTIGTNVAGVRLGECLEQTAKVMDKLTIVRSMTSPLGEHNFGTHYLMTGYKPSSAVEYPTLGATLAHVRALDAKNQNANNAIANFLPPNIAVPDFTNNVSGNGYLPKSTSPFSVGGNPGQADFKVRDLDFYQGLDLQRLDQRKQFTNALDKFSRAKDASPGPVTDPDLERAYNLIASPEAKGAFDLSKEASQLRQQYGYAHNGIGQCCLMARRLVERGVPFVTINNTGWDTHADIVKLKERYPTDRNAPLPVFDRAYSTLIRDLADRGLLDETLVIVMGEFGRTPKINSNGGRDHWPNVFSVALAGGGVRGGQIIGSSDSLGEFPKENPVTPSDLAATIYNQLGIRPERELHTSDGRPIRISPDGATVIDV